MHFYFLAGNFYFLLIKYLVLFFYNVFIFYLKGFLLKVNRFMLVINHLYFYSLLIILRFNFFMKIIALLDIVVVDLISSLLNRFMCTYSFWQMIYGVRVNIRFFIGALTSIMSIVPLYKSAGWLEREVWDMFGIRFLLHKNLRRILTDYGFLGHPLKKDFPLIGFVELKYDDLFQSITINPVESSQTFRLFQFDNPWF